VSLDQLVRAFTAAGGKFVIKIANVQPKKTNSSRKPPTATMILAAVSSPSRK
jgi:hypothetical protein